MVALGDTPSTSVNSALVSECEHLLTKMYRGVGGWVAPLPGGDGGGYRSLLDVAIGMTKDAIKYKVLEAKGVYLEAPTQKLKPTQRCAKCWDTTKKTLSDRVHVCQYCGHQEDRDINAAQVMLAWARGQELSSLDGSRPSSTNCGNMRQLGASSASENLGRRSDSA